MLTYPKESELQVKKEKIKQIKYRVEVKLINIGDEAVPIDDINITSFEVENYYLQNYTSIIRLKMLLDNKTYYDLMENKNEAKVKIKLSKAEFTTSEEYDSEASNVQVTDDIQWQQIFEDNFMPIFEQTTMFKEKQFLDQGKEDEESGDSFSEIDMPSKEIELYLFSEKIMKRNKKIVNMVFKEANIFDTMGYIFQECQVDSVLINKCDNDETYTQIILPPLTMKEAINYLHNYYGIYKSGVRLFHDYDYLYVLNKDLKELVTDSEDNYEKVFINILKYDDGRSQFDGCYKDSEKKMYKINTFDKTIQFTDSTVSKETYGNKIKVYDHRRIKYGTSADDSNNFKFGSGNRLIDLKNEGHYSEDKVIYMRNTVENDLLLQSKIYESKDMNSLIKLSMENIDISYFKPNKEFTFFFDQPESQEKHGGIYRLNEFGYAIVRNNSSLFMEGFLSCTFSKIENE